MSKHEHSVQPLSYQSLETECHRIAQWWMENTIDHQHGGFYGVVDHHNRPIKNANKGIILNTRILWFFSEASKHYGNVQYGNIAKRAYDYLINHFDDKDNGGVKWELDSLGNTVSAKKQTYAQAFAIYGLSAFYQSSLDDKALNKAMSYFELIESKTIDPVYGGYLEAFSANWESLEDVRLSSKDKNLPKSMNNHIHILEAYTALYRATGSARVGKSLSDLISLVCEKILDKQTFHLRLFQNFDWSDMSDSVSYGHDIECSWLVWDALNALGDDGLIREYKPIVLKMAQTCLTQSIGDLGQVCDRFTFSDQKKHFESDWWVQAESLVGFLNAFQLTGKTEYYTACEKIWRFTQEQHIDHEHGEWSWVAKRDQNANNPQYKACFWKGPYHNGRAMMEAAQKLKEFAAFQRGKDHALAN